MDNHYQWIVKCHVMKNYSFVRCCQYAARKEELIYHERRLQTISILLHSIARPFFFHFCCLISAKISILWRSQCERLRIFHTLTSAIVIARNRRNFIDS